MEWTVLRLDRSRGSIYLQLAGEVSAAIADGRLNGGDRLPSERDLARVLGISRTTVVNAYRELEAEGLVRGHVGRGTFVCAASGTATDSAFAWHGKLALASRRPQDSSLRSLTRTRTDADVISFAPGVTALELFPAETFADISRRVVERTPIAALGLSPTEGHPLLRHAIASRGKVAFEQVMVTAGAQQALDLIVRLLIDPGDAVIMDRPGYLGAIPVFQAAGAHLIGWDAARLDLDELEDAILRYRPKLLYATPTFQNPTGGTWPITLRREVLELARRYRLPIVEDEPYRELAFDGSKLPSLADLDPRGVVHIGTFSKTLAGGLRVGWIEAPPVIIDQLALIKQRVDVCGPGLTQIVVAELLTSGCFDRHLARLRTELRVRHDQFLASCRARLTPDLLTAPPVGGGIFGWARLGPEIDLVRLRRAAATHGVNYVPGDVFYADGASTSHIRLCFSGVAPRALDEGIRRLGCALDASRAAEFAYVEPLV